MTLIFLFCKVKKEFAELVGINQPLPLNRNNNSPEAAYPSLGCHDQLQELYQLDGRKP